ncbi:putative inactive serine protease 43 [Schistocerca gregaria]|uniref:putative inactive serine protease 43 n=1 Tax=Schistocerca gregaria TaxID=7010 RepID=UPI00211EA52C|nr:putative inactive serine protease 43 [Schistocerca gregaria]
MCQVLGFGKGNVQNDTAVARIMDQLMCSALHCAAVIGSRYFHTYAMCSVNVAGKTICQGDEGGPVLCSEHGETNQWGVISTMWPPNSVCRLPMDLNSYMFTAYYRNWILENIKDLPSAGNSVTVSQRKHTTVEVYVAIMTCGFSFL